MKTIIVYYSKTGNTARIAEAITQEVHGESFPINIMKEGRKKKEEILHEKELFSAAVKRAKSADLVILGTPTEFRKPHPQVMQFLENIQTRKMAVFCTYYGMLGSTLIDLEAAAQQKGIPVVGELKVRVGTEEYHFRQDVSQYQEAMPEEAFTQASQFAQECLRADIQPLPVRLIGVCGRDCHTCAAYRIKRCDGAGARCWSGRGCEAFECCIIRQSLNTCADCTQSDGCKKRPSLE